MILALPTLILCFVAFANACMDSCNSCSTGDCRTCKDSCISNCCQTSDCHTSNSCETGCHQTCQNSCQTNCCSSCSSCRNSCRHTCTTSTCNHCERNCCEHDCDRDRVNNTIIIHHSSREDSRESSHREETSDNGNTNNNDNNIATVVNLTNVVNTENRIYLPINITTTNINDVNVDTSCSGGTTGTDSSCENQTTTVDRVKYVKVPVYVRIPQPVPVLVKVPVPVQVPVRIPVAVPVPIPYPVPQPTGCCVIMIPCVSYGCSPYNRVCGDDCMHPFMFTPRNPCGMGGCHRRNNWNRLLCQGSGGCQVASTNCAGCSNDFYSNFGSYMGCHGCFYP